MTQRLNKSIARKNLGLQLRNTQKVGPQFVDWLQRHPGFDRGVRKQYHQLENAKAITANKPIIKPGPNIRQ